MTTSLSSNAQAILLLTAPLLAGNSGAKAELLSPGEYNRLAKALQAQKRQPADLLAPDAAAVLESFRALIEPQRLGALLGRGFLLSQAVEHWQNRAIWVISRADEAYPKRWKTRLKEEAPPVLYGCGDPRLLETGGLAVVGSREVDDALLAYTEKVGRLSAQAGRTLVSGGARGIDQAAMRGALAVEGTVVGVLADSLERAALVREHREALIDRRLTLVSPYDPAAGFNVGHAMQRNKLIYALADAALVVNSDFNKGGTWAGAIEQLEKYHCGPVYVRRGDKVGKGNEALIRKGAQVWPEPMDAAHLETVIGDGVNHVLPIMQQESLPLLVEEDPKA